MASSSLIFRGGNLQEKTGSIHIPVNLPPILSSSFKKRKGEKRPLNCSITVISVRYHRYRGGLVDF